MELSGWIGWGFVLFAILVGLACKYGLTTRRERHPPDSEDQE